MFIFGGAVALLDANCDGIDGVASLAVFFSPGGDETADGTREDPLASLSAGLDRAAALQAPYVLVASGVYLEPATLILRDGIGVHGGYNAEDWARVGDPTELLGAEIAMSGQDLELPTSLSRLRIHAADATAPGEASVALRGDDGAGGTGAFGFTPDLRFSRSEGEPGAQGSHGRGGAGGGVPRARAASASTAEAEAPAGVEGGPAERESAEGEPSAFAPTSSPELQGMEAKVRASAGPPAAPRP